MNSINSNASIGEKFNIDRTKQTPPKQEATTNPQVQDNVSLGNNQQVDSGVHKKWTFLHYGAGDNNLATFIKGDVDEMESIGSDKNTHLITQLDMGGAQGCKRYYLNQGPKDGQLSSPVLQDMGKTYNMADPKNLADFIVWGTKNFPSDNVAVILGSHGGGTMGAVADDGSNAFMSPQQLKEAFSLAEKETGKKVDVLGFDCCLMANTEVEYELKDHANFIVASEESEGGAGWPYHNILNDKVLSKLQEALDSKINIGAKEFASKIVSDAGQTQQDLPTMSTVDTSKLAGLAKSLDGLAKTIIETNDKAALKDFARKSQSFQSFKDAYHFCEQIVKSTTVTDQNLKTEAQNVLNNLSEAIIANENSARYPNAHGLQMEIPSYGGLSNGYGDLQFAKDTKWDEAMIAMQKQTKQA